MTEYLDRYPTMHEYAEGKRINPKLTDLISRADAMGAVVNAHPMAEVEKGSSKQVFWVRVSDVAKALKALPSADAVQGEWVDWLGNGNEWECSICKCSIESHGSIAYKYCPMCGARMKGGDTE